MGFDVTASPVGKNQAGLRVAADEVVRVVTPAKECCGSWP
jgi:hypothetical protein